ncbi:MAG: phosphotransferase family protein [Candidatus Hodarchaeales archaeon]|jgi:tRNA A-37 threonylcarbamoyl transferase component Bud32
MSVDDSSVLERALQKVAEGFKDYFCKVFELDFGQAPEASSVSIGDIKLEKKIGITGIRLVSVSFSTNLGPHRAAIAVKSMKTPEEALQNIRSIDFVAQRLQSAPVAGLTTPHVIFQGSEGLIVMEGVKGSSFRESPIPPTEKLRLAGRALCALHGSEKAEPGIERLRLLPQEVVKAIPIDQSKKDELAQLFEEKAAEIAAQTMRSGACAFGDFHPGNILYEVQEHRIPVIISHLIDPEFLDTSKTVDRCEDICNFFVTQAVSEDLKKTQNALSAFMAGYNEVLAHYGFGRGLAHFYERSPPVNFHLAQGILLSILNIHGMPLETFGGSEGLQIEIERRVNLSQELLMADPIYSAK